MAQGNATSEDQFLFLISCIKNATNGKPDFNLVAKERGIVNRKAAQKRYARLMKAHGVSFGGSSVESTPRKGVKSPPLTDDDDSVKQDDVKDEDVFKSSPSSKRKRGRQVIRGRVPKKAKFESEAEDDFDDEAEDWY
ncbi:hypothetical protein Dda_3015 [Drechslerella dactyloides]|uniref:Myb-like DNA-binding domain-containing protein n=1 Tax=Drechslerella dactyloides TaxID=74499 RepID=A0AAD6NLD7_DREDA|nr:hypothetical protein Dda_3015 [Drechslerella dactyloides]